ncbi:hypothetical protein FIBSPDRAFT_901912 [Athelia psychrophila]|uniref:Uncharacterized protein n=1 Tax=Athelia psychrophila TaxID=1759441 RepID=A0A165WEL4_9AGAM|nr:hypothetical protein FIBSPDRAFT_901912 [Fibularhizoctonia sp. CBS 109695]
MSHYIASIMARGSADGFSTESPERLHIDFAKSAYRATNKKNYIKQMTKWLTRQESCYRFATYLQWAAPGYIGDLTFVSDSKPSEDDEDEDEDKSQDDLNSSESEQLVRRKIGYSIAKQPAYPHLPIHDIIEQFGTTDLLPSLTKYLHPSTCGRLSIPDLILTTKLSVYKCFTALIPPAPQVESPIPAQFDTVLARQTEGDTDVEHPLDGLTVGQPHPLAYIEWFTPLQTRVSNLEMYQVSRSSRAFTAYSASVPPRPSARNDLVNEPVMANCTCRAFTVMFKLTSVRFPTLIATASTAAVSYGTEMYARAGDLRQIGHACAGVHRVLRRGVVVPVEVGALDGLRGAEVDGLLRITPTRRYSGSWRKQVGCSPVPASRRIAHRLARPGLRELTHSDSPRNSASGEPPESPVTVAMGTQSRNGFQIRILWKIPLLVHFFHFVFLAVAGILLIKVARSTGFRGAAAEALLERVEVRGVKPHLVILDARWPIASEKACVGADPPMPMSEGGRRRMAAPLMVRWRSVLLTALPTLATSWPLAARHPRSALGAVSASKGQQMSNDGDWLYLSLLRLCSIRGVVLETWGVGSWGRKGEEYEGKRRETERSGVKRSDPRRSAGWRSGSGSHKRIAGEAIYDRITDPRGATVRLGVPHAKILYGPGRVGGEAADSEVTLPQAAQHEQGPGEVPAQPYHPGCEHAHTNILASVSARHFCLHSVVVFALGALVQVRVWGTDADAGASGGPGCERVAAVVWSPLVVREVNVYEGPEKRPGSPSIECSILELVRYGPGTSACGGSPIWQPTASAEDLEMGEGRRGGKHAREDR